MNIVKAKHRQAMDLLDKSFFATLDMNSEKAKQLLIQAYEKEREAAEMLKPCVEAEPSRSVLFRSAASLALECGKIQEAKELIDAGLAGFPPEEIIDELKDLLDKIRRIDGEKL
jgi:predicted Zn-dependent protease